MISASEFRKNIDTCSSYSELIPYLQIILEQPITKEYGNSCLHALALLTQEHLEYTEWTSLLTKVLTSLTDDKFDKSTYPSLMRVYCNPFGYQFLETQEGFLATIENFLEIMDVKGITLRKRTISPLLEVSYRHQFQTLAMSVFGIAKVHQIVFDSLDIAYLLGSISSLDRKTVVKEILQTQTTFDVEAIKQLAVDFETREYTLDESGKCGSFKIPSFELTVVEQKQILTTLNKKVSEKCRKKVSEAFQKFCKSYKKKITAVVDGANVGRFQQGVKSQGALNYQQIKSVVETLHGQGHQVLVCLNENHFKSITSESGKVLAQIQKMCQVRKTPSGLDDDLCWLYACISLPGAILVTTDEMRNHIYTIDNKLDLWKQYQRVTFNICRETGDVSFNYPLPYYVKPHLQRVLGPDKKNILWIPTSSQQWTSVEM